MDFTLKKNDFLNILLCFAHTKMSECEKQTMIFCNSS
jgi:hypothetical protein